jgi:hypothetical protein
LPDEVKTVAPIGGDADTPTEQTKGSAQQQQNEEETQATRLIKLASGAELFHTPKGEPYATVTVKNHRETHALDSKAFENWLREKFYRTTRKTPTDAALKAAIGVLRAQAHYDGPQKEVAVRVAEHNGDVYIDLGDAEWRVIHISKNVDKPFEVLTESPVKFRRPEGMLALPIPEGGGSVNDLRPFINVRDDNQFKLVIGGLLGALRPRGPYPVLEVNGEQGSAKSTLSKMLRELIDPNVAPARSLGREHDLVLAANNGWMLLFDNVSHIPKALSDALCRISTGGSFGVRKLYSNNEEVLFDAQRPLVLNGIGQFITESDLVDRTIVLELDLVTERQDEHQLWEHFNRVKPRILGALCEAVSAAMRNLPFVKEGSNIRMADFAKWVTAAEEHLGWEKGSFIRAYLANRAEANARVLDDDVVANYIIHMAGTYWSGTATDLLKNMQAVDVVGVPHSPQALSGKLHTVVPNLRKVGVDIHFGREGHDSKKMIYIRKRIARIDGDKKAA